MVAPAVFGVEIFDAEVMIYGKGFMQRSGTAEVEAHRLHYAEMKTVIDSVELKEGKT